ncbi:aminotransferase class I/II-fold pyridoxal phosphate-dependent enzyme [Stomatohabitans albus]|uniref:aminotransferase class I/II-fold pyridoxal phosphate-dependent enzyme n=1 Tax=Stomatohabitans albus TaxID=3110766 RepID=UPI00300D6052
MELPTNPLFDRLGVYPLTAFADKARSLRRDGNGPVHDFSIGDPVEPTDQRIRDALKDAVTPTSQYPSATGQPALRAAIATWVMQRFGVEVNPDTQIQPTSGLKEGIFHTPLALTAPGARKHAAIWGAPGYQPYERGALFAGGTSDPVDLVPDNDWKLELDTLTPSRLDQAFIAWLNYPHNPTGAVVDLDYYRTQIATARNHGFVLGSDECYVDIYRPHDTPPVSLLQAADGDLTGLLVCFSLSKRSGMTGYRSGAMIGDERLIAKLGIMRPNIGTASPDFIQAAAITAWGDESHVAARREIFEAKRQVMRAFFDRVGLETSGSQATFYQWVKVPGGDDRAYADALLAKRIIASPGSAFGSAGSGYIRLALVPDVPGCEAACATWEAGITLGEIPS